MTNRLKVFKNKSETVHVIYSPSNQLELRVFDELRNVWKVGKNEIQRVSTIQKIRSLEKSLYLSPLDGDKWLVDVDCRKLRRNLKDIAGLVDVGKNTSVFLIRVENYSQFKEIKKLLRQEGTFNYLAWLSYAEISSLVDFEVALRAAQSGEKVIDGMYIGDKAKDFLCKGYGNEPEKVMTLCEKIREGDLFPDRKSIVTSVGVSSGSTDTMIFNLLKEPPKNVKIVLRNRLKVLDELVEVYGVRKTQNFLSAGVRRLIDIKILWMNGVIYNTVGQGIPEPYVYEELRRYNKRIDDLMAIPLERLVILSSVLGGNRWRNKLDAQRFLYNYYTTEWV